MVYAFVKAVRRHLKKHREKGARRTICKISHSKMKIVKQHYNFAAKYIMP